MTQHEVQPTAGDVAAFLRRPDGYSICCLSAWFPSLRPAEIPGGPALRDISVSVSISSHLTCVLLYVGA